MKWAAMENVHWQYCHLKTKHAERNWAWASDEDRLVVYNDFSDSTGKALKVLTGKKEVLATVLRGPHLKLIRIDSPDRTRNIEFYLDRISRKLGKAGWKLVSYKVTMPLFTGTHLVAMLKKEC
jgi:hypothetical protein